MKRDDLRSNILPTQIGNTDENYKMGKREFDTEDLIYLDSYEEQYKKGRTDEERKISATDYAKMNFAYIYDDEQTRLGRNSTCVWLRSASSSTIVTCVNGYGYWHYPRTASRNLGLCPSLHYHLPSNISARSALSFFKRKQKDEEREKLDFDIKEVKDKNGRRLYSTLQIGEYPKTKVSEEMSQRLESLYHGGKLQEGITATGKWFSCNGQKEYGKNFAGKHNPEFEYEGNRYVRVVSYPNDDETQYTDGTKAGNIGTIRWVKVEPISFEIRNWDEMPTSINPNGNGRAKFFDLRAEEAILANIPFYPDYSDANSTMWQNSTVRGFLNGIDVRNITKNGNSKYSASKGGNFTGECSFFNEAFNLAREPMKEYSIPESETEIPDDAFHGCVALKKIVIHPGVKKIGKNAFKDLSFQYVYRTQRGELVFSEELPKNPELSSQIIEIGKVAKAFQGFDYGILLQAKDLTSMMELAEKLNKTKFNLPYVLGKALMENGCLQSFSEQSDFRFLKNEIPDWNNMLSKFSEEEKLDFFKFAQALGCFSTQKMKNKNGKETEVILAQKASSLLAQLIKTEGMKLRQLSWFV